MPIQHLQMEDFVGHLTCTMGHGIILTNKMHIPAWKLVQVVLDCMYKVE